MSNTLSDDVLGVLRLTKGGLEVKPLNEEAETLIQRAKEQGKKVRISTKAQLECSLEPEVPAPLTMCAALEDLKAARDGEMDTLQLLERTAKRELLRERWEKGELDDEALRTLEDQ